MEFNKVKKGIRDIQLYLEVFIYTLDVKNIELMSKREAEKQKMYNVELD